MVPIAQWLQVTAFVCPATGASEWYLTSAVSKPLFEKLLADFAGLTGAGVTLNLDTGF